MTELSGTGLVADDLYLLAHNDLTGRPYVRPRALGLGLAGGLLSELMVNGHINVWHEQIVTLGPAVPGEGLARTHWHTDPADTDPGDTDPSEMEAE